MSPTSSSTHYGLLTLLRLDEGRSGRLDRVAEAGATDDISGHEGERTDNGSISTDLGPPVACPTRASHDEAPEHIQINARLSPPSRTVFTCVGRSNFTDRRFGQGRVPLLSLRDAITSLFTQEDDTSAGSETVRSRISSIMESIWEQWIDSQRAATTHSRVMQRTVVYAGLR